MNIISIPKEFIKEKELVLIPRRKLEELVRLAKRNIKEVVFTPAQKKVLQTARRNKQAGSILTFDELKDRLGITI